MKTNKDIKELGIEEFNTNEPGAYDRIPVEPESEPEPVEPKLRMSDSAVREIEYHRNRLQKMFKRWEDRRNGDESIYNPYGAPSNVNKAKVYNPILKVGTSRQKWYKVIAKKTGGVRLTGRIELNTTPEPKKQGVQFQGDSGLISHVTFVYQH